MAKNHSAKKTLHASALSLLLCVAMLVGTTFAWFTDSVSSANNVITAGNLDVELYYQAEGQNNWTQVSASTNVFKENSLWEPGHTEVIKLKVVNEGNLALKYKLGVNVASETGSTNADGDPFKLSDFIKFGIVDGAQTYTRDEAVAAVNASATALKAGYASDVLSLAAENDTDSDEKIVTMVVYMPKEVGNEVNHAKGAAAPSLKLGINVFATQDTVEADGFDGLYDADAALPELAYGTVAGEDTVIEADTVAVEIPEEAGDGDYQICVDNKSTTTNASNETVIACDITLYKNGAAVTEQAGVSYGVQINVGPGLDIARVLHKGVEVQGYAYDAVTGIVSFSTASFSPFEVILYTAPEGAVAKVKGADGKLAFALTLAEAFAAAEDGAVITLIDDVALTETAVFDKDATVTLDMNGKTVSGVITTLVKLADGTLSLKNGALKNVHDAATETKYGIYMCGDAKAEIKDVAIETTGIGIYMTENAHVTELNATIDSYITVSGYCSFDAVSLLGNARIDLISGGSYKTYFAESMFEAKLAGKTMSYNQCYTVNLNSAGAYIGEIRGGTFIGAMDTANNGTPIHVNNGTVDLISGGYFGFAEKSFSDAIYVLYANTANGGAINKITGGTYEKGFKPVDVPKFSGYGCDFENIVAASGCQVELTGETVVRGNQLSTKVKEVTLEIVRVIPQ